MAREKLVVGKSSSSERKIPNLRLDLLYSSAIGLIQITANFGFAISDSSKQIT